MRPLVYESSFNEFIAVEDYALYWGNSPEISDDPALGQTGNDLSENSLLGGRVGLRHGEWKAGLSATIDRVEDLKTFLGRINSNFRPGELDALFAALKKPVGEVSRWRWGAGLSFYYGKFSVEGEIIHAGYNDNVADLKLDRDFNYATLGYQFNEALFAYLSYQTEEDGFTRFNPEFGGLHQVTRYRSARLGGVISGQRPGYTKSAVRAGRHRRGPVDWSLYRRRPGTHLFGRRCLRHLLSDICEHENTRPHSIILWMVPAHAQVVVVAHLSVPADTLTSARLLDLYTGDVQTWDGDEPVVLFEPHRGQTGLLQILGEVSLARANRDNTLAAARRAEDAFHHARAFTITLLISGILSSFLIGGWLVRYIAVPVQKLE